MDTSDPRAGNEEVNPQEVQEVMLGSNVYTQLRDQRRDPSCESLGTWSVKKCACYNNCDVCYLSGNTGHVDCFSLCKNGLREAGCGNRSMENVGD